MVVRSLSKQNLQRSPIPISEAEVEGVENMTIERMCSVCGANFYQIDSRGQKRKTCSLDCKNKYRRAYMKKWRAKQKEVRE